MAIIRKPELVARETLSKFLDDQLAIFESQKSSGEVALRQVLYQTREAIEALRYGELQPIFTPRKTRAKGAKPYSVRKEMMAALGFVDLLRSKGVNSKTAIFRVADAYCVTIDAIKSWQKQLRKINDPLMKRFRTQIALSIDWDEPRLLRELKNRADRHRRAKKKKS